MEEEVAQENLFCPLLKIIIPLEEASDLECTATANTNYARMDRVGCEISVQQGVAVIILEWKARMMKLRPAAII